MSIDVSHLVVIGCSLAYCQGLESPKTQGWPALVANRLGLPVVNLSGKGAGNDKIMRRLFEYHYLNLEHNNNPFYIISFSHSDRREEYVERKKDYTIVDMHPDAIDNPPDDFSAPCLINHNPQILSRRKLMLQTYILNFLKANNLNYATTDYLPDHIDDIKKHITPLLPKAYEEVQSDKYRLRDFIEISKMHTPLPCNHDDVDAQIDIANYTVPKLLELYGEINAVNKPYATLADYAKQYPMCGILNGVELDWF